MTHVDRDQAMKALTAEWEAIDGLIAGLTDEDWHRPTALPGWDVQANVSHVIGTEAMLLGEPAPAVDIDRAEHPHVRNDIGAFNEAWVVALAGASPERMLDEYRSRISKRIDALAAMTDDEWETEGFTPGGPDTYGRFMRIRVMDCWMHEQDIREAVGQPGHDSGPAVDLTLDEITAAMGYVIGKRAGAPDGSLVTIELTGPTNRSIHVAVDGRAAVVDALPGPATTTLRMPVVTFSRLAGGRSTEVAGVEVQGDTTLGAQVLANLAYMI